jgi:hypothetical protein
MCPSPTPRCRPGRMASSPGGCVLPFRAISCIWGGTAKPCQKSLSLRVLVPPGPPPRVRPLPAPGYLPGAGDGYGAAQRTGSRRSLTRDRSPASVDRDPVDCCQAGGWLVVEEHTAGVDSPALQQLQLILSLAVLITELPAPSTTGFTISVLRRPGPAAGGSLSDRSCPRSLYPRRAAA